MAMLTNSTGKTSINANIKKKLSKKQEFLISLVLTIPITIVSAVLATTLFEAAVFSLITFIACNASFTWYNSEDVTPTIDKHMTALDGTIKCHAQECKDNKIKVRLFIELAQNFGIVSDKYSSSGSSFIVDLYKKKIDTIQDALNSINIGKEFDFDTDIFRRFPDLIFDGPVINNVNYFYSTAHCGEQFFWFSSREGEAYLEHIDRNTQDTGQNANGNAKVKHNVKRIFIYTDNNDVNNRYPFTPKDWIFVQLHINSGYQVKIMKERKYETIYPQGDPKSFGVYRQNFMWKKSPDSSKTGTMSVDSKTIKQFTETFETLWNHRDCIYPQVPQEFKDFCNNEQITNLHIVIERAKRRWNPI